VTPWANGTCLQKCTKDCKDIDTKRYQSLTGALMYLAVTTRPDITQVVSNYPNIAVNLMKNIFVDRK
ncbi:unnamed protein product, partial [Ceratitis capitata]